MDVLSVMSSWSARCAAVSGLKRAQSHFTGELLFTPQADEITMKSHGFMHWLVLKNPFRRVNVAKQLSHVFHLTDSRQIDVCVVGLVLHFLMALHTFTFVY